MLTRRQQVHYSFLKLHFSTYNLPSSSSTIVSHSCTVTKPSSVISDSIVNPMQKYGGSIGALLGMYLFRHKTQHKKFTLGVPAILLVQVTLIYFFFR